MIVAFFGRKERICAHKWFYGVGDILGFSTPCPLKGEKYVGLSSGTWYSRGHRIILLEKRGLKFSVELKMSDNRNEPMRVWFPP